MSKQYLITCNLKTANWNYTNFYNAISKLGAWWHYIDCTWIIKNATLNTKQIYEALAPHLSKNDFILIVEIVPGTKNGWLPSDAWKWLSD